MNHITLQYSIKRLSPPPTSYTKKTLVKLVQLKPYRGFESREHEVLSGGFYRVFQQSSIKANSILSIKKHSYINFNSSSRIHNTGHLYLFKFRSQKNNCILTTGTKRKFLNTGNIVYWRTKDLDSPAICGRFLTN